ncbi:MAG: response regulator [Aggregatilineales bacterium]
MRDYTLLAIDDDINFVQLVEAVLQTLNIKIEIASNGTEGIELAETRSPDLIMSDMLLPGIGGSELIAHLKQNPATSHIPVIAITAGGNELMTAALEAGADELLTKPFNMKEFRDLIKRYAAMKVH